MTNIKLCGLTREEDIKTANKLKPEYIGFVFYDKSRRNVTKAKAKQLKSMLNPEIKAVGVFVDAPASQVEELLEENIIDVAQLHGNEDDEYIKKLKEYTKLPIINAYRNSIYADYVLYDNENPGKGLNYDINKIKNDKPFFLAGGISIDNIDTAKALNPYCIDVSSGAETKGFKDEIKIKELIEKVRSNGKR
jgi:tryptophan synthase beta chain